MVVWRSHSNNKLNLNLKKLKLKENQQLTKG